MTTITRSNIDITDFGYQDSKGSLNLGSDIENKIGSYALLRFQNVTVPSGATVSSATITFVESGVSSTEATAVAGTLFGVAVDNFSSWNSTNTSTTATPTANSILLTTPSTKNIYAVTTIISEIVGRSGWASGNSLGFFGSTAGMVLSGQFDKLNSASTSSTGATVTPILSITYTSAGVTVSVTVGSMMMMGVGI